MGLVAHQDLAEAQLEGRLARVEDGGGFGLAQAAAHGQHRDEDVGRVSGLDRDLDDRVLARDLAHIGVDHALALDGHQGRGLAEGHTHLEAGRLAGLVAALFGDDVDAVVVALAEPPLVAAGHVDVGVGVGRVALGVFDLGLNDDAARGRAGLFIEDQAAAVGREFDGRADALDLLSVLIGVEPAHQARAVAQGGLLEEAHGDPRVLDRPAV
ncbi:MAG: hypothetical protein BWY87_00249 [Deltaproteobacteria bacterium ADurb.Bin510]|nr:MAG: hypothetical protein BWY87_00249 [Deltaproteobacteria bacterium ADurb.Bin510]